MIEISIALVVCFLGLIIYWVTSAQEKPKVSEIAFAMFQIGLFVFLLCLCNGGIEKLFGIHR